MSRENYDNYDQEDLIYHAADHSASESINSETMEKKDPAINQHENDSQRHKHTPEYHDREENENDTDDPFFQKNAEIAQDLDEDLKSKDKDDDDDFDNDANRRTLDESKADEDEDDDED
ncbi:hypothetical protein [Flavobacterium sp.]|uniref:hypothetical protein n=1 Tax=Flavobacterium sp. TaxID=239 RepID=UPI0031E44035